MSKRNTFGINPLDAVIPPTTNNSTVALEYDATQTNTKPVISTRVVKERLTVHLPINLIDRIKNAVYWTPGLTLASLAEDALLAHVNQLEQDNDTPFPPRRENLKGGRPMK